MGGLCTNERTKDQLTKFNKLVQLHQYDAKMIITMNGLCSWDVPKISPEVHYTISSENKNTGKYIAKSSKNCPQKTRNGLVNNKIGRRVFNK